MEQKFNNHYELAGLIREKLNNTEKQIFSMGRVDILLRFLQKVNMDNPSCIKPYLEIISNSEKENIVDKIVELLLTEFPEYYKPYIEAKFEMITHNPYTPIENQFMLYTDNLYLNEFMKHFIEMEKLINDKIEQIYKSQVISEDYRMNRYNIDNKLMQFINHLSCDKTFFLELKHLYNIRNIIIYYNDIPESELLRSAVKTIEKDLEYVRELLADNKCI
jgi:hypothetical protein